MKTATSYVVRNLRLGEAVSPELLGKWSALPLVPEWVWVIEQSGEIAAVLITAPVHGILFLWRIAAVPSIPSAALLAMLRTVFREARERGQFIAMTYLTATAKERKLMRIARRAGWLVYPDAGYWAAGSTEMN